MKCRVKENTKKIPPGAWMSVLCVVSRDKKAKCRTMKTKKNISRKYIDAGSFSPLSPLLDFPRSLLANAKESGLTIIPVRK
jgi:hypothetical protein